MRTLDWTATDMRKGIRWLQETRSELVVWHTWRMDIGTSHLKFSVRTCFFSVGICHKLYVFCSDLIIDYYNALLTLNVRHCGSKFIWLIWWNSIYLAVISNRIQLWFFNRRSLTVVSLHLLHSGILVATSCMGHTQIFQQNLIFCKFRRCQWQPTPRWDKSVNIENWRLIKFLSMLDQDDT